MISTNTPNNKLCELLRFASKIGLRWPSEPSYKVLTSIWLIGVHGFEDAFGKTGLEKFQMLTFVKSMWKREAAVFNHVADEIVTGLPAEPDTFKTTYPKTWNVAFGSTGCPGVAKASQVDILRVGLHMPLRASNHLSRASPVAQPMHPQWEQAQSFAIDMNKRLELTQQLVGVALQRSGCSVPATFPGSSTPLHMSFGFPSEPGPVHMLPPPGPVQMLPPPGPVQMLPLPGLVQMLPSPLAQASPLLALTDASSTASPNADSQNSEASNALVKASLEKEEQRAEEPTKVEVPVVSSNSQTVAAKDAVTASNELLVAIKSRAARKKKAKAAAKKPSDAKTKPANVKVQKGSVTKKATPAASSKEAETKAEKKTASVSHEASSEKKKMASVSHEASRSQFMCRTGLSGPGQCFAIKYSQKKGDLEKAKKQAQKWLADQ